VERGQGTSIASRWPLGDVREVDLHVTPRTAGFACTTLIAEIAAPVGPLLFANHVLAGDFTSDPEAANVRFVCGRQSLDGTSVCYRDAWESVHAAEPGETFTPRNPLVTDWD
jgi:hypothetical protein